MKTTRRTGRESEGERERETERERERDRARERESSAVIRYCKDTQLATEYWATASNGVGTETKLHFGL
jgi:hypothetical protein